MLYNLRKAIDDFVQGVNCPEIIALNPKEWAWLCDYYYPPQTDEPNTPERKAMLFAINKSSVSFRWSIIVFREDIKPGVARMWKFEPNIEIRDYFLWMCTGNKTPHQSLLIKVIDGEAWGVPTYFSVSHRGSESMEQFKQCLKGE